MKGWPYGNLGATFRTDSVWRGLAVRKCLILWRSLRDSNPCYSLERAPIVPNGGATSTRTDSALGTVGGTRLILGAFEAISAGVGREFPTIASSLISHVEFVDSYPPLVGGLDATRSPTAPVKLDGINAPVRQSCIWVRNNLALAPNDEAAAGWF